MRKLLRRHRSTTERDLSVEVESLLEALSEQYRIALDAAGTPHHAH